MSDNEPTFKGFSKPKQNWSKLPHLFIALLPAIKTLSELKVMLYILRHTWGFQEFGIPKKITVDEFMHGRKRKNQTRMDAGTGMVKVSVLKGLRLAEEHGLIVTEVDDHDKGRVRKSYMLRMDTGVRGIETVPLKGLGVQKLYPGGTETIPRTEKDTLERKSDHDHDLWTTCLAELEQQMTKATFSQWLAGSELVDLADGEATIQVRDGYAVDWCASRLRVPIERTLSDVAGNGDLVVKFVV